MRPTLEAQLKAMDEEDEKIRKFFSPSHPFDRWLYFRSSLLWRIVRWKWFNIWTGEGGFIKFARHGFKEWGRNKD